MGFKIFKEIMGEELFKRKMEEADEVYTRQIIKISPKYFLTDWKLTDILNCTGWRESGLFGTKKLVYLSCHIQRNIPSIVS